MRDHPLEMHHRRQGTVIVLTVVVLVVLIGFASLTLDVGAMYNTRADLQNAADSAALSGASMLASDAMLQARIAQLESAPNVTTNMYDRAVQMALKLKSFGAQGTILDSSDVTVGRLDLKSATSLLDTGAPANQLNAIQVVARRSRTNGNGPLNFFFASYFGHPDTEVQASATAAFDDHLIGIDPEDADIIPFTIHVDEYNRQLSLLRDNYAYDPDKKKVSGGSDVVAEVDLYPSKLAPGNFGILNIGNKNQGTPNIAFQTENGVPAKDIEKEIGEPILKFFDGDGNPISHTMTGNPGLKSSLQSSIEKRIGDIVGVPIHSSVKSSGANTEYEIIGIRFVRVMDVSLKSNNKYFWIQPVSYTGPGVIVDPVAPSSGGVAGKIVLVR